MKTFITRSLICLTLVFVWQLIPISHQVTSANGSESSSQPLADDLKGTVWTGTVPDTDGECEFEYSFAADGTITYNSDSGCWGDCMTKCTEPVGRWEQKGNTFSASLEFIYNNKKVTQKLTGVVKGERLEFKRKMTWEGEAMDELKLMAHKKQ